MSEEKEELLEHIQEVTGTLPLGVRRILTLLSHPDLLPHVKKYFVDLDDPGRCLNYEPPWDCEKEAESYYENIKHGWLGGGVREGWCDPCRVRVSREEDTWGMKE